MSFFHRFILIAVILLGVRAFADYDNITGSQLLYFGVSPSILGSGGAYLTDTDSLDTLPLNPAAAAGRRHYGLHVAYLGLEDATHGFSISAVFPTEIGVFGFSITGIDTGRYALDQYLNLQFLFAKQISTKYKFALDINFDLSRAAVRFPVNFYSDIIVVYESDKSLSSVFGYGEARYGFAIKNFGLPNVVTNARGRQVWLKPIQLRGAASFTYLQVRKPTWVYKSRLAFDTGFDLYPFNFLLNGAMKHIFSFSGKRLRSVAFQMGSFLATSNLGIPRLIPFTFGFEIDVVSKKVGIKTKYALGIENIEGELGTIHALSVEIEIGKRDFENPAIDLREMEGKDTLPVEELDPLPENF